ncbi:MAG: hypothetical protein H6617_00100 [Bdellovibrionaceae bacterium]|nr:hypothetical protein [Pseudobdellovibrionaceae bacterium]
MPLILLIVLLVTGLAWRYVFYRHDELVLSVKELALSLLAVQLVFLLSAVPLVWLDKWSLSLHAASALVCGLPAFYSLAKRFWFRPLSFRNDLVRADVLILASAMALAAGLQWHSINYIFPTHDSGVYLSAAHHLETKGQFLFHDPTVELKKMAGVSEFLKSTKGFELFGLYPHPSGEGVRSFHGLFGAPVWYAFGLSLFGPLHAVKMNLFHLLCSLLLLLATLQSIRVQKLWSFAFLLLFVASPLVAPLYREPLSEPLAQVFFLGMVFVSVERLSGFWEWRWWFLGCLLATMVARATGLMYVPFFALAVGMLYAEDKRARGDWRFWISFFFGLSIVGATVCRVAPHYITGLVASVVDRVAVRLSGANWELPYSWLIPMLLPVLSLVLVIVGSHLKLSTVSKRDRRWWVFAYFGALLFGLVIRYGKTFLYLPESIGGFPFVEFNLDSVLFYIGPLVFFFALYGWTVWLSKQALSKSLFLQTYLPFCLFFYLVYYFGPFPLQVYLQRCFLTEFVPLAVIGMAMACVHLYVGRKRMWIRTAYAFSLIWGLWVLSLINHADVARGTASIYEGGAARLASGGNKILVAGSDNWRELTYIVPFATAYGYPLLFAGEANPDSQEGIRFFQALREKNYQPLWVSRPQKYSTLVETGRLDQCVRYPQFSLKAPPLELGEHCMQLAFYRSSEETRLTLSK